MTFAVPFDGSDLASAALVRAGEYARVLDESVVVMSAVSTHYHYAKEKGWVERRGEFDIETVARHLWEQARDLVDDIDFEYELVGPRPPAGAIAKAIRNMIRREEPSVVFVGSDNAGRIAAPVSSVGDSVAAADAYDVYLVRSTDPPAIDGLDGDGSVSD